MWSLFKTPWNLPVASEVPKKSPSKTRTEPVIGWRAWKLNKYTGSLYSCTVEVAWPHRKAMQVSDPNWYMDFAPAGIHAYKFRRHGTEYVHFGDNNSSVFGSIFMWGRVVEHSEGYRSEFAYPREILVPENCDPTLAMLVEDNYGVPVQFTDELHWLTEEEIKARNESLAELNVEMIRKMVSSLHSNGLVYTPTPSRSGQTLRLKPGMIIPPTVLNPTAAPVDEDKK